MNAQQWLISCASALTLAFFSAPTPAQVAAQGRYVRIAELEIDPAQLDRFHAAIKEGIEAAVRLEPDVLVLYAVAEKEHPTRIRVFEVYTDAKAYETHLQTPHFRKFRDTTEKMVTSRRLLDAVPIVLGAKPR